MAETQKSNISLEIDADVLEQAQHMGLNLSEVVDAALAKAVAAAQRDKWLEENAQALAEHAEWYERNGHPLADIMIDPTKP